MAAAKKTTPTKPRPRARRRNPKYSWMDRGLALLGGVAVGGLDFAIDGLEINNYAKKGIVLGVGVIGGGAAAYLSSGLGDGMIGAGTAVGGIGMIKHAMAQAPGKKKKTKEMEAVEAQLQARYLSGTHDTTGTTTHTLGAHKRGAAYEARLQAVEARLANSRLRVA